MYFSVLLQIYIVAKNRNLTLRTPASYISTQWSWNPTLNAEAAQFSRMMIQRVLMKRQKKNDELMPVFVTLIIEVICVAGRLCWECRSQSSLDSITVSLFTNREKAMLSNPAWLWDFPVEQIRKGTEGNVESRLSVGFTSWAKLWLRKDKPARLIDLIFSFGQARLSKNQRDGDNALRQEGYVRNARPVWGWYLEQSSDWKVGNGRRISEVHWRHWTLTMADLCLSKVQGNFDTPISKTLRIGWEVGNGWHISFW